MATCSVWLHRQSHVSSMYTGDDNIWNRAVGAERVRTHRGQRSGLPWHNTHAHTHDTAQRIDCSSNLRGGSHRGRVVRALADRHHALLPRGIPWRGARVCAQIIVEQRHAQGAVHGICEPWERPMPALLPNRQQCRVQEPLGLRRGQRAQHEGGNRAARPQCRSNPKVVATSDHACEARRARRAADPIGTRRPLRDALPSTSRRIGPEAMREEQAH